MSTKNRKRIVRSLSTSQQVLRWSGPKIHSPGLNGFGAIGGFLRYKVDFTNLASAKDDEDV